MFVEIITPDKKLYSGEAKLIKLPGTEGGFEILTNHAPIISTLVKGQVKIIDMNGQTTFVDITGGIIESKDNQVIVLAESQQPD